MGITSWAWYIVGRHYDNPQLTKLFCYKSRLPVVRLRTYGRKGNRYVEKLEINVVILNQVNKFLDVLLGNKPRLLIWEFIA